MDLEGTVLFDCSFDVDLTLNGRLLGFGGTGGGRFFLNNPTGFEGTGGGRVCLLSVGLTECSVDGELSIFTREKNAHTKL